CTLRVFLPNPGNRIATMTRTPQSGSELLADGSRTKGLSSNQRPTATKSFLARRLTPRTKPAKETDERGLLRTHCISTMECTIFFRSRHWLVRGCSAPRTYAGSWTEPM